KVTQ
ncbi:hypothetical protein D029_4816B, partial [Vibrio parahaemolyticus 970107]